MWPDRGIDAAQVADPPEPAVWIRHRRSGIAAHAQAAIFVQRRTGSVFLGADHLGAKGGCDIGGEFGHGGQRLGVARAAVVYDAVVPHRRAVAAQDQASLMLGLADAETIEQHVPANSIAIEVARRM